MHERQNREFKRETLEKEYYYAQQSQNTKGVQIEQP
jgi:hypothetical protein